MRRGLLVLALSALGGCATKPPVVQASAAPVVKPSVSPCADIEEHLEDLLDADYDANQIEGALARATAALATCEGDPRAEVTDVERIRAWRGSALVAVGKADEGEAEGRRALATLEAKVGHDHRDVATALGPLESAAVLRRDYKKAIEIEKQRVAIREKVGPAKELASSLSGLGVLLSRQMEATESVRLAKRAVDVAREAFPAESREVASAIGALGEVYRMIGRADEAEPLLAEALAIKERLLGRDHSSVASANNNLAAFYHYTRHDLAKAEPLYRRALEQRRAFMPPNNTNMAQTLLNLGALLCEKGEWDEGRALFDEGAAIMERTGGKDNVELGRSRAYLKRIEEQRGRP